MTVWAVGCLHGFLALPDEMVDTFIAHSRHVCSVGVGVGIHVQFILSLLFNWIRFDGEDVVLQF